jgi:hypothetical protein
VMVAETEVEEDHDQQVREEVGQVVAEDGDHAQVADALGERGLRGRKKFSRWTGWTRR